MRNRPVLKRLSLGRALRPHHAAASRSRPRRVTRCSGANLTGEDRRRRTTDSRRSVPPSITRIRPGCSKRAAEIPVAVSIDDLANPGRPRAFIDATSSMAGTSVDIVLEVMGEVLEGQFAGHPTTCRR